MGRGNKWEAAEGERIDPGISQSWFIFLGKLGGMEKNLVEGAHADASDAELVEGTVSNGWSWDIMGDCYDIVSKLLQACLHPFFDL